jgi:predicted RNA polymerase sigma factor
MADAVARRSYGKLVAFLAARTGDVAAAEDALSEAFATALADWPMKGCPENPEAWLLTVARRRVIDMHRGRRRHEIAAEQLHVLAVGRDAAGTNAEIPDQRLALMFACGHPAIDAGIRAPLILQVVLGLDAKKIASAFLTSPVAMGKRLVRAKDKIRQAGIASQCPGSRRASRPPRDRTGRHLRGVRRRLDRRGGVGYRSPRSHTGSHVSSQARDRIATG